MGDKRRLKVWAADPGYEEDEPVARPFPGEALYARPNPDGTRKACQNCVQWVESAEQCLLMDEDVVVPAEAICGYHVFGKLSDGVAEMILQQRTIAPIDPEFSGFDTAGGTSCDRCAHYAAMSPADGKCKLLLDPDEDTDFTVEPLACCAHWVSNG